MTDAKHARRQLAAPLLLLLLAAVALAACGGGATGAGQKAPSAKQVRRQNNSRPAAAAQGEVGRAPYGPAARVATLEDESVRRCSTPSTARAVGAACGASPAPR